MRFFYCDPDLEGDLGHYANSCRAIVGELRSRGVETHVFAGIDVEAGLRSELGAIPCFRALAYSQNNDDPHCGWLSAFLAAHRATFEDFCRIEAHLRVGDVVYVNSGQAAQLMALSSWMARCPLPVHAVIEFGVDPGLDVRQTPTGTICDVRDPRVDARSLLYRFASNEMSPAVAPRLHMATFDAVSSNAFQVLLRRPVATLPVPRGRIAPLRSRVGARPVTVAFLGHQRREKGYHLVPAILEQLTRIFADEQVHFLVHNGAPEEMPDVQNSLRAFASSNPRCTLDERLADDTIWAEILNRADLIVCPYANQRFILSYSAVACEAVANGIPLVVPMGTTMARLAQETGSGIIFDEWTAESIVRSIVEAIRRFDELAHRATTAAEQWSQKQGPARCVDALLQLAR